MRPTMLLRAQPKPLVELDGHVEVVPLGRIALPGLPLGTLHKPTLELDLEAPRTATQDCRLTHLAQGLGWSADYTLHLDPSERWARARRDRPEKTYGLFHTGPTQGHGVRGL